MVHNPLGTLVEQGTGGMDENLLVVAQCFVAFTGIFLRSVVEEAGTDSLTNLVEVFHVEGAARNHWKFESIQYLGQLLPDILGSLQGTCLDEVIIAPLDITAVLHPYLIDCQHCQMISIFVVKPCSFLVSKLLLLPWSVENILD